MNDFDIFDLDDDHPATLAATETTGSTPTTHAESTELVPTGAGEIVEIDPDDAHGPTQVRVVIPVSGVLADPNTSTLQRHIATAWAEKDPPEIAPYRNRTTTDGRAHPQPILYPHHSWRTAWLYATAFLMSGIALAAALVAEQGDTTPPPPAAATTPPSAVTVTSTVTDPTLERLWGVVPNDLSCTQTSRPAEASAALFCKGGHLPQGALYEFFPDRTTMNDNFDADLSNGTTVPCPGGLDKPSRWHSRETSQQSEGQVACMVVPEGNSGSYPHVVWTLDSEHVVAWAEGEKGASVDAVFGWWTAHYPEATQ
jgi:hypothetical protein